MRISKNAMPIVLLAIAVIVVATGYSVRVLTEEHSPRKAEQVAETHLASASGAVLDNFMIDGDAIPAIQSDSNDLLSLKQLYIKESQSFVFADLNSMIIEVYEDGRRKVVKKIASKGKDGSWWETPSGFYRALGKEDNHFSSIGKVWMPWSVQFYGNFFIHGWPHYPDGQEVPSGFSGGCIRLHSEDAKEVYDAISPGMPILVYDGENSDQFYSLAPRESILPSIPNISAKVALIAEMGSGRIILNKNADDPLPVASLTKLMTAVVTSELINMERSVKITSSMLPASATPYEIKPNTHYRAFDLLYPLLMQSSNVSAEALATFLGKEHFIQGMNSKAEALGMSNTVFSDASGLNEGNISTAKDLLKLLQYISEKRHFIFDITKGVKSSVFGPIELTGLTNFNHFVDDPALVGSKVGNTLAARQTGVSVWSFDSLDGKVAVAIVVLGSEDSLADESALLDWLNASFVIE